MKTTIILLISLIISSNIFADKSIDYSCYINYYKSYAKEFNVYWKLIDKEFKNENIKLYNEFSYIVKEQLNSMRISLITLNYLSKNNINKLNIESTVMRVVPIYNSYHQNIFRELRKIPEYNRLYLENRSYEHNERMPEIKKLQEVTTLLKTIKKKEHINNKGTKVLKMAQELTTNHGC